MENKAKDRVIFFLLERNPPCPNSLIESICSGVPSIGLDEGSYVELSGNSGYAINPNLLNKLDQEGLYCQVENSIQYVVNISTTSRSGVSRWVKNL